MLSKVKDGALLSVFVLCGYVLGWIWTWFTNVPMIHNFIDDGYFGFPTIDWIIVMMFVALGVGSFLVVSNLRTKLILAGYNIAALTYWWMIETGKFHSIFPDVISELYLGASILTGLVLVTLVAFISNSTKVRVFLVLVVILMSALTPMVINTLIEPEPITITAIENVRPENFQLVGTDKYNYAFATGDGQFLIVGFIQQDGNWFYYWPSGKWTAVPFIEETFDVPMSGYPELIMMKVWIDEEGIWVDQTPDMFDLPLDQGPQL